MKQSKFQQKRKLQFHLTLLLHCNDSVPVAISWRIKEYRLHCGADLSLRIFALNLPTAKIILFLSVCPSIHLSTS